MILNLERNCLVCFRYNKPSSDKKDWLLISRWTEEVESKYSLARDEDNINIEPIFPDAVYLCVPGSDQTVERLRELYSKAEKKPCRMKTLEHDVYLAL